MRRFIVPSTTPSYPDGLTYRLDLPDHLAGPDGFTNSGQLSGTHNLDNAKAALDAQGATYTLTQTGTNGISILDYSYSNSAGKMISGSKTVYDPAIFSDEMMLNMAQDAGQSGFESYLQNRCPKCCGRTMLTQSLKSALQAEKAANGSVIVNPKQEIAGYIVSPCTVEKGWAAALCYAGA